MRLRFRTGVNTGLVLVGEGENLAIGDAVNVAARLEQAAQPDEILLGAETLHLVRDAVRVEPLEPLALKGKSRPVPRVPAAGCRSARAWFRSPLRRAARRPRAGAGSATGGFGSSRSQESGCHLFTLLGAAGVGKSRLVAELLSTSATRRSVLQRSLPSLRRRDHVLAAAGGADAESASPPSRCWTGSGTGGAATPEELFLKVRRLLESLATGAAGDPARR